MAMALLPFSRSPATSRFSFINPSTRSRVVWLKQIAVGGKRAAVGTSIAVLILVPFASPGVASAKRRFRDCR